MGAVIAVNVIYLHMDYIDPYIDNRHQSAGAVAPIYYVVF